MQDADPIGRLADALYQALAARTKPDTHRNMLSEVRTFWGWLMKQEWVKENPFKEVEAFGRRSHGKPQLTLDDARKWMAVARTLYTTEPGAVAATVTFLMGFRASEVTKRTVRDLDDNGRVLWIPTALTKKGVRATRVPLELQDHLRRLAGGRDGRAPLFEARGGKFHWRDWPREWVQRICNLAGVDKITAHSMRGLHTTLAVEAGVTSDVVAASVGHENFSITEQSYASAEAVAGAAQQRTLKALGDGSK